MRKSLVGLVLALLLTAVLGMSPASDAKAGASMAGGVADALPHQNSGAAGSRLARLPEDRPLPRLPPRLSLPDVQLSAPMPAARALPVG